MNSKKKTDVIVDTNECFLDTAIKDIKEIYIHSVKIPRNEDTIKTKVESINALLKDLKIDGNVLVKIVSKTSTKKKYTNILYIAIENYAPELDTFLESLIQRFPELISLPRKDEEYKGHTAFHLAVCKNNKEFAKKMLDKVGPDKEKLFREWATGSNFKQTVMLGELPLFTAALSFNKEMFEFLLDEDADLYKTNSKKDNIYHALIRYADFYPNKEDEVIVFLKLVMDTDEEYGLKYTDTTKLGNVPTKDTSKELKHANKTKQEDQNKVTSRVPMPADTTKQNKYPTKDMAKETKPADTIKQEEQTKDTSKELKHANKTKQEDSNKETSTVPMPADTTKQNKYPTKGTSKEMKPADTTEQEESTKDTSKELKPGTLWSWRNNSGLNPLELATTFGLCQIFGMICNSKPYCIGQGTDGLKDIKTYDITDLDPVVPSDACSHSADSGSILLFLFQIHPSQAFPFIRTPQVSKIIEEKWKYYRWLVYIWFILHVIFMGLLTWYAIERSKQNTNDEEEFNVVASPSFRNKVFSRITVTVFAFITLIWGVLYVLHEIGKMIKFGIPCTRKGIRPNVNKKRILQTVWKWLKHAVNPYSNWSYRRLMALFSISLILDSCFTLVVGMNSNLQYEQYCLYISLIIGWLFVIFFLRVFKYFSFFGVLLQKVIFGDVIRFILVFFLIILGFGTAMFMAIQGSPAADVPEYSTFGRTLISMITLIGGLGDLPSFTILDTPEFASPSF